jgi:hypothetical protein
VRSANEVFKKLEILVELAAKGARAYRLAADRRQPHDDSAEAALGSRPVAGYGAGADRDPSASSAGRQALAEDAAFSDASVKGNAPDATYETAASRTYSGSENLADTGSAGKHSAGTEDVIAFHAFYGETATGAEPVVALAQPDDAEVLSPRELELLARPAEEWTRQDIVDASWIAERLGVLLWYLGALPELFPYDRPFPYDAIATAWRTLLSIKVPGAGQIVLPSELEAAGAGPSPQADFETEMAQESLASGVAPQTVQVSTPRSLEEVERQADICELFFLRCCLEMLARSTSLPADPVDSELGEIFSRILGSSSIGGSSTAAESDLPSRFQALLEALVKEAKNLGVLDDELSDFFFYGKECGLLNKAELETAFSIAKERYDAFGWLLQRFPES